MGITLPLTLEDVFSQIRVAAPIGTIIGAILANRSYSSEESVLVKG